MMKHIPRLLMGMLPISVAILLNAGLLSGSASAVTGCRSDPIVILSNLKTMDISTAISDSTSDLHGVTYTMHLPKGVRPVTIVPTDGLIGQVEHFSWTADQAANTYVVTSLVSTGANVPVTLQVLGILARSGSASGMSNKTVSLTL